MNFLFSKSYPGISYPITSRSQSRRSNAENFPSHGFSCFLGLGLASRFLLSCLLLFTSKSTFSVDYLFLRCSVWEDMKTPNRKIICP